MRGLLPVSLRHGSGLTRAARSDPTRSQDGPHVHSALVVLGECAGGSNHACKRSSRSAEEGTGRIRAAGTVLTTEEAAHISEFSSRSTDENDFFTDLHIRRAPVVEN